MRLLLNEGGSRWDQGGEDRGPGGVGERGAFQAFPLRLGDYFCSEEGSKFRIGKIHRTPLARKELGQSEIGAYSQTCPRALDVAEL